MHTSARITAVEPVAAMRAALERNCPTVRAVDGTAEQIPVPDASADAVIAAQSFHWFDGERALPEIHRVLRPGGLLGMIWNVRDEASDWSERLTEIFDRLAGEGAPGTAPAAGVRPSEGAICSDRSTTGSHTTCTTSRPRRSWTGCSR